MTLAHETRIPPIVICSKRVQSDEVIEMAEDVDIKAYALDLAAHSDSPPGITFETSSDVELAAACSITTRDLSTKRNLGLVLARMLGWQRLMFLDDDIYGISSQEVNAHCPKVSGVMEGYAKPHYYQAIDCRPNV